MTTTATPPPTVDSDYPLSAVPHDKRRGNASVIVVLLGFLFFTPTMLAGAQVAVEFDFAAFLGWAALATAVLAAYIALMGGIGARTGLTTVLIAKTVFGRIGGKWSSLLLGGTQVGWYGITLGTLADLMGRALGWEVTWPIVVIGGILMAVTAYRGFRGIELLSWVSVPLMLALCVWVLMLSVEETGGWGGLLATPGSGGLSVGAALTIMIGTFISGGTQVGNWTRFARSGRWALGVTFVCVFATQFLMLAFGGVGAAAFGQGDFAELLVMLGLIGPGLLLLIANLWTTNDNTAYAFGVAGAEMFNRADKRPFIVGGVIIGIIIALTGASGALAGFLTVLGTVIPPLGGAVIGYFFLVWRGRDPQLDPATAPLVRWSGLGAYLVGVAAAVVGTVFDIGIPAVQGILVAIIAAPIFAALERRAKVAA